MVIVLALNVDCSEYSEVAVLSCNWICWCDCVLTVSKHILSRCCVSYVI